MCVSCRFTLLKVRFAVAGAGPVVKELIDFLAGHLKADEAIALSGENALLAFTAVDVRLKLQDSPPELCLLFL